MSLTSEQQSEFEIQSAIENLRITAQQNFNVKQTRLETIRIAQTTLIENSRSKPVDSRDITADDIITFATALQTYIDA